MATNVLRNSGLVIENTDIERFTCDISFIGNMYIDDYYDRIYSLASDNVKTEMDNVISEAYGKWSNYSYIEKKLSVGALNELGELCKFRPTDMYSMSIDRYLSARLFARRLTYLERRDIAYRLSKFNFRIYTSSENINLEGVDVRPKLNYDNDLPKAYHLSKINLNITLHSITSGVPLRVFDIMGVGGFMLTNYQPEIEELFDIGQEIEVFRDLDEMEDKIRYYLKHENARMKIALNGYRTVTEKHSYNLRFYKMMDYIKK